ncbi:MAG: riboflavin biosynthesis protein RibF [Muribaculaceae bacterium]|nr:riboflavin biosynthesis protein RibF [Muribaculaceae bacterium]
MKKAVTIGTFDGVHRGHRLVLDTLKKEAAKRGLQPVAMTFDRHPLELIAPDRAPGNLMTTLRKTAMIRQEGVEPIVLAFTEQLRRMRVYEWLDYIHRKYDVELLVAGYDNTFGSDGIDLSISDYKDIGATVGIEVISAPEEEGVSSSAVRKAVRRGDIWAARQMLGHSPELEGKVIQGFHIGRELGFPTANLQTVTGAVMPPVGVYAATAYVGDEKAGCPAMVNIGRRPTFEGTGNESDHISVETHIIGKDEDLYGSNIRLEFLDRLRDEKKFGSIDELKQQLNDDKTQVMAIIHK